MSDQKARFEATASDTSAGRQLAARLAEERPRLVRLCARLTGNREAAEDLAQETLVEAWRHREKLHDVAGLSSWSSAIARNVCKRWTRERGRREFRDHDRALSGFGSLDEGDQGLSYFDVEIELEQRELGELLDRAMDRLAPQTRAVLTQRYIEDLPHTEIAERLRLSEGAVRIALHRGKLALKRVLIRDFPGEAAAYGPMISESVAWQETRIWCPVCGKRRFIGRLDPSKGAFELRCPDCYPETGRYAEYTSPLLFGGITGYKTALNRVMRFVVPFYQDALSDRAIRCPGCRRTHIPVHTCLPPEVQPDAEQVRGVHLRCGECGSLMSMRLSNLVLYQPRAWEFWRDHPRIHLLPERNVEVEGRPCVVVSYQSVHGLGRVDVIAAADTYEILSIHRVPGG